MLQFTVLIYLGFEYVSYNPDISNIWYADFVTEIQILLVSIYEYKAILIKSVDNFQREKIMRM